MITDVVRINMYSIKNKKNYRRGYWSGRYIVLVMDLHCVGPGPNDCPTLPDVNNKLFQFKMMV